MNDSLICAAISCVNNKSQGQPLMLDIAVTLNFHPDAIVGNQSVMAHLVNDGVYRSQFETATSNGSLSAHVGGRRWNWESTMFCSVYDNVSPCERPKYGALNYQKHSAGAAPRFGSSHLRLKSSVLHRCTFAYPDSHLDPVDFATRERMKLIALAKQNKAGLDTLDDFIEAHVHGPVRMDKDVEAIVLDPSFRNTPVEAEARCLPFDVEWHDGFCLDASFHVDCLAYRGDNTAEFLRKLSGESSINAASLSPYRDGSVDAQIVKKAWHCIVKFGRSYNANTGEEQ